MEERMGFAEVAVDAPVAQRTFSYSVPKGLNVMPGQLVWVPFGSRVIQGIIFQLVESPAVDLTKDLIGTINSVPVLSPVQLQLAAWLSQYYLCPLFTAAALMLPPDYKQRILTYYSVIPEAPPPARPLTPTQELLLRYLRRRGPVELRQLEKAFRKIDPRVVANQLVRRGLLLKTDELEKPRVRPKTSRYVRLLAPPEDWEARLAAVCRSSKVTKRSERLAIVLSVLHKAGTRLAFVELSKLAGASRADLSTLTSVGLVGIEEEEVFRDPLSHRVFPQSAVPVLTPAQEAIWREIESGLAATKKQEGREPSPTVFLLHGVTGSGKTELYLRALALAVKMDRRAIILVPEIALTPQTVGRFLSRFPGTVAVLHSGLSLGEQYDEWRRIKAGEFDVVIGSRSAIFAPVPDLGLIVLDEEHEWTYKQTEAEPRYHCRDVAIQLAKLSGAAVILGSATPDVASYHRAQVGEFKLVELQERITSSGWASTPTASLPGHLAAVEVIDLRQELRAGNRSIFSRALLNAATIALAAGEQVILFLNRRGTSTFVLCRDCGFVLKCKRCDMALTYHSAEEDLVCHLCNYRTIVPDVCPSCWSPRIRYLGVGTQKVEEEAKKAFPGARLLRWDRDAARRRGAHEQILDKFTAHEADILIGTQMIAKGLDLPLVTLVGIICADVGLYLPDFRANEHTFQILTQVAGRAGRGVLRGKTIVQTYSPEHYAVAAASQQDFGAFYRREITFRSEHENPPFSQLAKLLYVGANNANCQKEAQRVAKLLRESLSREGLRGVSLVGPAPAYISRLRGRYRWQILLRGQELQPLIGSIQLPGGWSVDIDPVSLL